MKKNNETIAFFNGFYIPHLGGVERYTSKIVEELKKHYNIIIITTNDNNYNDIEVVDNVKIYRLPTYKLFKNRYPILKKNNKYKNILKSLNKENIDYVICNTRFYQTSLLGAKMAKNKKCRLYFIEHASNHVSIGNRILDKMGAVYEHYLTNKIKKYNPKFYGVSKRCNEWLKHFNIKASGVFYNSIDDEAYNEYYHDTNNKKIIISYIGRIIPEKGIINLLEAYKEVSKKFKNLELVVAGDGPILESLKKEYKLKSIRFLGKIDYDEVMKLCVNTDIFVHPSMYPEGLPTSILEAGIMECAIIATDRGGTKEVIINDDYGLIVSENKDDLVNKLTYLLNNPDIVKSMKKNIHNRIMKEFTWKQTAKNVIKELKENER